MPENDFHFSYGEKGGEGLVNGNPIAVCSQSHLSGTKINTAVRIDTSHHLRMIFISLMGGGLLNGNPIVVCSQSHFSGTEMYTAV